jgi:catechol-2,3-dioxygenase
MAITELGHTGLWVFDLPRMRDFYTRVLGLTVTDENEKFGLVFLSSRPEREHHEIVLQRGRTAALGEKLQHQISWRVESLEDLAAYHRAFQEEGVKVQYEVTHGNALAIYFYDPEENRNEVYLAVDRDVRQPFRRSIDLTLPAEELWAEAERLLEEGSFVRRPER